MLGLRDFSLRAIGQEGYISRSNLTISAELPSFMLLSSIDSPFLAKYFTPLNILNSYCLCSY